MAQDPFPGSQLTCLSPKRVKSTPDICADKKGVDTSTVEETRRTALQRHDTSPGGFSRTSTLVDIASYALDKSEKADKLLVGWYGPDDPDV